jgi:hypothetical protein
MALKRELAEDELKLIKPAVEITGIDIEDGGDVIPYVVDRHGLRVEFQQGHGFVVKHGCTKVGRCRRSSRAGLRRCSHDGGRSGRPLPGGACKGFAGALGRVVPFLGRGRGLLLCFEGAGQSGASRAAARSRSCC